MKNFVRFWTITPRVITLNISKTTKTRPSILIKYQLNDLVPFRGMRGLSPEGSLLPRNFLRQRIELFHSVFNKTFESLKERCTHKAGLLFYDNLLSQECRISEPSLSEGKSLFESPLDEPWTLSGAKQRKTINFSHLSLLEFLFDAFRVVIFDSYALEPFQNALAFVSVLFLWNQFCRGEERVSFLLDSLGGEG